MKIVLLTGSPHKTGTSRLLAEKFMEGAKDAGHEIFLFDTAFSNVHPCIGCDKCECGEKECVFKDDMLILYPRLIEADLIAYATPLYYHGMSAQLKTVIDRYHGIDKQLCKAGKKAVLLVTGAGQSTWVMNGIEATYETDLRYLGWKDCGRILAIGCYSREDIEKTDYPDKAYKMGRNL